MKPEHAKWFQSGWRRANARHLQFGRTGDPRNKWSQVARRLVKANMAVEGITEEDIYLTKPDAL